MSGLIPQNRWLTVHESQASAPAPARESHTRATSPAAASLRRYVLLGAPRPAPSACVRARSPSRAHCLSSASISQGKFSDVVGPSVKVSERYPWESYAMRINLCFGRASRFKKSHVNRLRQRRAQSHFDHSPLPTFCGRQAGRAQERTDRDLRRTPP